MGKQLEAKGKTKGEKPKTLNVQTPIRKEQKDSEFMKDEEEEKEKAGLRGGKN